MSTQKVQHAGLFELEQAEHAAWVVADFALRRNKEVEDIDEVEFSWHYSRDGMGTTTRSKVYPSVAIRARATEILTEMLAS